MYKLIKAAFQAWYEKKFCKHEWLLYKQINVMNKEETMTHETRDTLLCKKCGEFKKINL